MIDIFKYEEIEFENFKYRIYESEGIKYIKSSDYAHLINTSENHVKMSLKSNLDRMEENKDFISFGIPENHYMVQPLGYDLSRELKNKYNAFLVSPSGMAKMINIKRDFKITTQKIENFYLTIFKDNSYKFVNTVDSKEGRFIELIRPILKDLGCDFHTQYWVLGGTYRVDLYIKDINLIVEFDEVAHEKREKYSNDSTRQKEIEDAMNVTFLRIHEKTHLGESLSKVIKKTLQLKYNILGD